MLLWHSSSSRGPAGQPCLRFNLRLHFLSFFFECVLNSFVFWPKTSRSSKSVVAVWKLCPRGISLRIVSLPLSLPIPFWPSVDQIIVLILTKADLEDVEVILQAESKKEWGSLNNLYVVAFSQPVFREANDDGNDTEGDHFPDNDQPTKTLLNTLGDLCRTRWRSTKNIPTLFCRVFRLFFCR